MSLPASPRPVTGLILTGGGARAAYQGGVLEALRDIRAGCNAPAGNPYPVIVGTSAGALNAAVLASGADDIDHAVTGLVEVWANFRAEQVYRTDAIGVVRSGARWLTMMSIGWVIARWRKLKPRSLLDNEPLTGLLARMAALDRVPQLLRDGHLQALAVSASSYSSGQHITFFDSADPCRAWQRSQRRAVHDHIPVRHRLAPPAFPFVFPPTPLRGAAQPHWFGDGSMRQVAPISPAVHLGAERILVTGAGRMHEPPGERRFSDDYPNVAQIAGHALSNIFLDALAVDVERLQRINATLSLLSPEARARTPLRPIDVLVIAPSQRLDDIAARHLSALPTPIRALLGGVGVSGAALSGEQAEARGAALASYLLFEADYTRELMALGRADTLARREEVLRFFEWGERTQPPATAAVLAPWASPAAQRCAADAALAEPAGMAR